MTNEQCICNHGDVENTCFPLTRCACKVHGKFNTMTNDLKNFLEEEITDFGIDFGHARNCDIQPPNDGEQMCSCGYEQVESRVKSMNTRLINFVLDLVEKDVYKKLLEKARKTDYADRTEYDEANEIVSTIINNLRV